MHKTKITATFIGADGSCGYKKDKEYNLEIEQVRDEPMTITSDHFGSYCEYTTIISFLNNWNNIKHKQ